MSDSEIQNITCAEFNALSEVEQRTFVIGVCNGRGMTSGLFQAFAGVAEDMASSPEDRQAIAASFETIQGLIEPLLTIDATSLLNGLRVACRQPELQDEFVIGALASIHIEAARAVREFRESS